MKQEPGAEQPAARKVRANPWVLATASSLAAAVLACAVITLQSSDTALAGPTETSASSASSQVPTKAKKPKKPKKPVKAASVSSEKPKKTPTIESVNPRAATSALSIAEATLAPRVTAADYTELIGRGLQQPIAEVQRDKLRDMFSENRGEGRAHEAIDIAAATGTPVVAVDDGVIVKLFTSKPGGLTVYQFDPSNTYCYYYAHLDKYAPGLKDGQQVRRGDLIGYVGSTGNASPNAPHLHLAIFKLGPEKRWWHGTPINPYTVLSASPPPRQP